MENTTEEMYFRPNGAQLTDKVDIEADKTLRRKDILRNAELGRINESGRYVIPAAVLKELLFMTKYIYKEDYESVLKESKDVLDFKARGFLPVFGAIEFRLVVKDNTAKLFIFENVYREFNGYQEIYGEQISECAGESQIDEFIDKLFTLYNFKVVEEEDLEGKRPEELADSEDKIHAIMFTKIYLNMISKDYLKVSATDEKETFDDLVGILKEQGGDYGKKVLRHFIDRIEKRPDIMQIKDEEGYNESLNDMLIGAIEVATTEEDMKDPGIEELYRRVYQRRYEKTDEHMKEAQLGVKLALAEQVTDKILGAKVSTQDALINSFVDMLGNKPNEIKTAGNLSEQGRHALEESANPILKQRLQKEATKETAAAAEVAAAADKQEVKKPAEVKTEKSDKKDSSKDTLKPSDIWKHKLAQTFVADKSKKVTPAKKAASGGAAKLTPQNKTQANGNAQEKKSEEKPAEERRAVFVARRPGDMKVRQAATDNKTTGATLGQDATTNRTQGVAVSTTIYLSEMEAVNNVGAENSGQTTAKVNGESRNAENKYTINKDDTKDLMSIYFNEYASNSTEKNKKNILTEEQVGPSVVQSNEKRQSESVGVQNIEEGQSQGL